MRNPLIRLLCLLAAGSALCVQAGCGGGSPAPGHGMRVVHVSERDFHISAPRVVRAGDVRLSVKNRGPDDHEFIVVRSGSRLPLRHDGLTVDEDAVEKATLAAIEPAQPDATHSVRVHLAPGRYQLLCNMTGHYMGGMHAHLVVQ